MATKQKKRSTSSAKNSPKAKSSTGSMTVIDHGVMIIAFVTVAVTSLMLGISVALAAMMMIGVRLG